ncbi:Hypothetical predicted protein, partial [Pelobates cultripes]
MPDLKAQSRVELALSPPPLDRGGDPGPCPGTPTAATQSRPSNETTQSGDLGTSPKMVDAMCANGRGKEYSSPTLKPDSTDLSTNWPEINNKQPPARIVAPQQTRGRRSEGGTTSQHIPRGKDKRHSTDKTLPSSRDGELVSN